APSQPSPCLRHACHACCLDTRMTLTEADVARLRAAGEEHFFITAPDGSWQLRNVNGRCVFLTADGRCSVYERRPEGCALYPLVLDLAAGRVVRDPFCPHRLEFPAPAAARRRLRRSVAREEREAQARRLARGPR
ncbi:MAG: YkgJ family cysteine cluster protein, partial [Acidobacteriota bacterium]